eukprot:972429-Amphidinium_carterae.1
MSHGVGVDPNANRCRRETWEKMGMHVFWEGSCLKQARGKTQKTSMATLTKQCGEMREVAVFVSNCHDDLAAVFMPVVAEDNLVQEANSAEWHVRFLQLSCQALLTQQHQ